MDYVTKALREVYEKELVNLPVSKDLPRLCKKFSCRLYDADKMEHLTYGENSTELALYKLLNQMSKELYKQNASEQTEDKIGDLPSQDAFTSEVNLNIHETLNAYLIKHYGEKSRLARVLKSCCQSIVIATLTPLRLGLEKRDIKFKDCRGEWYLEFSTGKTGSVPVILQRRKEQAYKVGDRGVFVNLYTFEWEIAVEFDALTCNSITKICIRYLGVDFKASTEELVPTASRPEIEAKLKETFTDLIICAPELDFKLK